MLPEWLTQNFCYYINQEGIKINGLVLQLQPTTGVGHIYFSKVIPWG